MRLCLLACLLLGLICPADAQLFTTLRGKHLVGYQGWFACPQDHDPRGWVRWFRGGVEPSPSDLTVDLWPDASELPSDAKCNTELKQRSGQNAVLFSSASQDLVRLHFQWMRRYGIDGAVLNRFVNEIANPILVARPDKVLSNVRIAAEAENRSFMIMYDLSGMPSERMEEVVEKDWLRLSKDWKLSDSFAYARHRGKPVVALWGIGFTHVKLDPPSAQRLINFFKEQGVAILGGVPAYWRTLERDSQSDPAWKKVYASLDVLSPWTVGRFRTPAEAAIFDRTVMAPDIAATDITGQDYMPVIFPGFSWFNLRQGKSPIDQIPRLCGTFYQAQVKGALASGANMLFTAMFDEVNEGTAIFKLEQDPQKLPAGARLLIPDLGSRCEGGNDLYLRLAGEATLAVRKQARERP